MTLFGTMNANGTVTTDFEIDLNTVPSTDPLAFCYGVQMGGKFKKSTVHGYGGTSKQLHGSLFGELTPEYLRGFLFGCTTILVPEGTKIKNGQERNFFLSDLNIRKL